jgi:DNA repair exonuclease SbcCD ATPase subunit
MGRECRSEKLETLKKEVERLKFELGEKESIMAQANKQLEEYEFDIKKMQKMRKENKIQNRHIEDLGHQIKQVLILLLF